MAERTGDKWFRWLKRPGRIRLSWATRITLVRIFLIVPFVAFMLNINDPELSPGLQNAFRYAAVAIYFFMAVSDALDGYLARRRHEITMLGTFLDPLADKLLITSACLLLVSPGGHVEGFLLPPTVVVLIVGKDLFLVIGFAIVYFITSQVHIAPVFLGKLATALQLVMVAAILLAPEISLVVPGWLWVLRVLWWSAAGTAILATLVYIRNGSRYIEQYERTQAQTTDAQSD
jgi:CDP-diacylglycerol--glycerol-3-phosphate 3-phosphatidyltransferase/cardiolipin synthase